MTKIGPIQLPLTKTVTLSNEMDIIDMLLDSKIPGIVPGLNEMIKADIPQILAFQKQMPVHFVGVVLYKPPDILMEYDNQKYMVIISRSLLSLREYFIRRKIKSRSLFEIKVWDELIQYFRDLQINKTYPKLQYYITSSSNKR